jgi:hypothetical protein
LNAALENVILRQVGSSIEWLVLEIWADFVATRLNVECKHSNDFLKSDFFEET